MMMANRSGEEVAADVVTRKMAAKWKQRVFKGPEDTGAIEAAFSAAEEEEAPNSKAWFRGSTNDPARDLAMKWKQKEVLPSISQDKETEARDQFSKEALTWLDIVANVLHGCTYLVSKLRDLFTDSMKVSLIPSAEWAALTKLLTAKGLPGEAKKLGTLVLQLRKAAPIPVSLQSTEGHASAGRGEITSAIEGDALIQMTNAKETIDVRIKALTADMSVFLAAGKRREYLMASEQVTSLQLVMSYLQNVVSRVQWRASISRGITPAGPDPEKEAEQELREQLAELIHELAKTTRSDSLVTTVLGSFGTAEAVELKAVEALLEASGALDCYVTDELQIESQLARVQRPVTPKEPKPKPKKVEIDWANRFHTENSAIRGLLRRRHSISDDPSAARAAAALAAAQAQEDSPTDIGKPAAQKAKPASKTKVSKAKEAPSGSRTNRSAKAQVVAAKDNENPATQDVEAAPAEEFDEAALIQAQLTLSEGASRLLQAVAQKPKLEPSQPKSARGGAHLAPRESTTDATKPVEPTQFGFALPGKGQEPKMQPNFRARRLGGKRTRRHSVSHNLRPLAETVPGITKCNVGFGGGGETRGGHYNQLPDIVDKPLDKIYKEYYEVLGVSDGCNSSQLKRAYLAAASSSHPDKNNNDPEAATKFSLVAEAYRVLADPALKNLYDHGGAKAVQTHEREQMARERTAVMEEIQRGKEAIAKFS